MSSNLPPAATGEIAVFILVDGRLEVISIGKVCQPGCVGDGGELGGAQSQCPMGGHHPQGSEVWTWSANVDLGRPVRRVP